MLRLALLALRLPHLVLRLVVLLVLHLVLLVLHLPHLPHLVPRLVLHLLLAHYQTNHVSFLKSHFSYAMIPFCPILLVAKSSLDCHLQMTYTPQ